MGTLTVGVLTRPSWGGGSNGGREEKLECLEELGTQELGPGGGMAEDWVPFIVLREGTGRG